MAGDKNVIRVGGDIRAGAVTSGKVTHQTIEGIDLSNNTTADAEFFHELLQNIRSAPLPSGQKDELTAEVAKVAREPNEDNKISLIGRLKAAQEAVGLTDKAMASIGSMVNQVQAWIPSGGV